MSEKMKKFIRDNYQDIIFFTLIPVITNIVLFWVSDDMFDFFHSPDYKGSLFRATVIIITHTILSIPLLFIDYAFIRISVEMLLEKVTPEGRK